MDNTLRDFFVALNSENEGYKQMTIALHTQENIKT